jgi:tetratricopeptide (TPR) repeat protein
MKLIIISLIIIQLSFVFLSNICFSQISKGDNYFINEMTNEKTYYYSSDTIKDQLVANNLGRLREIETALNKLPIDKCHHGFILYSFVVDTIGKLINVKLLSEPYNKKMDSLILATFLRFPDSWFPAKLNNQPVTAYGKIGFQLLNAKYKSGMYRDKSIQIHTFGVTQNATEVGYTKNVSYSENCENGNYFYDLGLEEYKKENFKKAIYNFKSVAIYNHFDTEALYHLGISYIKLNKFENACKTFKESAEYGDEKSIQIFIENCKAFK